MSAIAAVFNRDGCPTERTTIRRVLRTMESRGPDGVDTYLRKNVGLGHCHFWTTPEEVGERQPLVARSDGLAVVLDGRLDNRTGLLRALGVGPEEQAAVTDAALILRAFAEWREECFHRLIGPFAAVLVDTKRDRVVLVRDPLGSRPLYYHLTERLLVAASEEQAVLAHPLVHDWVDDVTLARFFAVRDEPDERTFFVEVAELPPAHLMVVSPEGEKRERYWQLDLSKVLRYGSDRHYAEHFHEVLERAVKDRMRSPNLPAVMLSGGLDSTSVAALAARRLGARGKQLTSISYGFDELPECDETEWIASSAAELGLDARLVRGDPHWPLSDVESLSLNPNAPHEIPYRSLIDSLLSACAASGSRVLLTGTFSDELYTGLEGWLADLLSEARFAKAVGEVLRHIWSVKDGSGSMLRAGTRCAIGRSLGRSCRSQTNHHQSPVWMTNYGRARLMERVPTPTAFDESAARRPEQIHRVLGARSFRGAVFSLYHANRHGVETRHPYRDRRLIELMLALPAHQLYGCVGAKAIVRSAMRGIVPEAVRTRRKPTSLVPLYRRGMVEEKAKLVRALITAPDALWRAYVREDWLLANLPEAVATDEDPLADVAVWNCVAAELWWRRRSGLALPAPRNILRVPVNVAV